jgi:hypothetical protein
MNTVKAMGVVRTITISARTLKMAARTMAMRSR